MDDKTALGTQYLEHARFSRCWRSIGAQNDSAFHVLSSSYSEAHRFYHNANHIAECLAWLDQISSLAECPDELEVALFFHDLVYKPGTRNNEARSCELFQHLAHQAGISKQAQDRIGHLIRATAHHTNNEGDAALIIDIDLSILGTSPHRFARYEKDIRHEYSAVNDETYRVGRARILAGFLERICIYRTPEMAARLEIQARNNLSRALMALDIQPQGGI